MNQTKERFIEEYNAHIKRDGADELLNWLQSSDFLYAPASTKYHGSYDGGLVEHSLNVYDCLVKELETAGLSDTYTNETVAIVSLLHDIWNTTSGSTILSARNVARKKIARSTS